MAYQSPIPIRAKAVNPFAVFLDEAIPDNGIDSVDAARASAAKELANKSRTLMDFGSIFGKGVIGGLQTIPDLVAGPTSEPSQFLRGLSDTWGTLESPQYKAKQAVQADEYNALGPDASLIDKGLLAGKHAFTDPLGTAAMAAGNLAPFVLGGAAGLGGKAGAMALSGLMGGGAVRGGIFDAIQQAPDNALMADDRYAEMRKTMPESEAKIRLGEIASSIEEAGGKIALGVGTGIASGAFGAEAKALDLGGAVGNARNQLIRSELEKEAARGIVKNFLKGGAEEALSEFPEEGSQQYLSNTGAGAGGAKIDPWANVAESAVQAGIAGFLGGGLSHGLNTANAKMNLSALNQAENADPASIKNPQFQSKPGENARDWLKKYSESDAEGRRNLVKGLSGKLNFEDIRQLGAYTDDIKTENAIAAPTPREATARPIPPKPIIEPKPPINGEIGEADTEANPEEELTAAQIAAMNVLGPLDGPDAIDIAREVAAREVSQPVADIPNPSPEASQDAALVEPPLLPTDSPGPAPQVVEPAPVVAETLPPAEAVDSAARTDQLPAAVEAPPSVAPDAVGPNGTIEPIRRLREQIKNAVQPGTKPAIAEQPAVQSSSGPAVNIKAPVASEASSDDVLIDTGETAPRESNIVAPASEAPSRAAEVSVHDGKVAQASAPVKVIPGPVRGGDTVVFKGKTGTANSHPLKGMVNVSFEDGTVKRVPLAKLKKIEAPPAPEVLEVVPEPTPRNHIEILKKLRSVVPENAKNRVAFDTAAVAYEKNPTPDSLGAVLREAKKAGLEPWAPGEAFATALDAIEKGQDPFTAVRNRGISEASARAVVKKAEAYKARMAKTEDVDVESQLRASIEAAKKKPKFQRDAELTPEEFAQQQMDEYHRSFDEDMATRRMRREAAADSLVQPGSLAEKAARAFQTLKGLVNRAKMEVEPVVAAAKRAVEPKLSEEETQNHNGVNDNDRGPIYDEKAASAEKIEGTKFKVADFEGDVDKSVVTGLTKLKDLADKISSVASRVSMAAGLPKGTFAGFSPAGNFAGVTWRNKVWINPLKHLGLFDNPAKMARAIVKTLVHEMVHTNGFAPHDAAFHAEFNRVMAAVEHLIPGMEFEIAKSLPRETIKKLRGLNGTAEKGWSVARQKGREATVARRRANSAVPSVQSETERDGNLPPPDSEGKGRSRTSESAGGKTEELGAASESGRATETKAGEGKQEQSGVLKPEFARAFHGTPHKFDKFKFDETTVGTGEGAQAYGHGLYFAESEALGRQYAEHLSRGSTSIPQARLDEYYKPGRLLKKDGYTDLVKKYDKENGYVTVDRTENGRTREVKFGHMSADWSHVNKVLGKLEPQLYHVDIPDEVVDRMLDWDKPLSQQKENVKEALKKAYIERGMPLDSSGEPAFFSRNTDGESLYNSLVGSGEAKNASDILFKNGIPGIKYLDGNSRSSGEGSRNFVVFNDKDVTILTRNGEKISGQEKADAIEQMQEQHPETATTEKPLFAREAEESEPEEIELPKVTTKQKAIYEFVNKHARIGEMMKAVQDVTGKKADVDLEEAAIAVAPQVAAVLRKLKDYHVRPLAKLLGDSKISINEAESYIHDLASGKDVSEYESGPNGEAFKALDKAVLDIIRIGNEAAKKSGLKPGKVSVDPEGPIHGIIQRAIDRTQKTVVKAAENTFRRQVAKFLSENISPEWAINPKNQAGGHTVSFQVDGKRQRMWFKDKTLAEQIESLSDGETSWFMDKVRLGTRGFAMVNTRLNPVFPVKNFIRDLFFGMGKIYVDDGSASMMKVLNGIPDAIKAMVAHSTNPEASRKTEFGKLADEMFSKGGIPEWFGLPSEETIRASLEADINEFDGSKSGKAFTPFKRLWNAMKIMSEASEGATRLAYFKVLRDAGVPMQEAIKKTRGVTGDFQRHGSKKNMRYAYAFFNSSIQGADAMAKLTKELRDGNPRARNLAMFLVAMGMSQALLGMAAGDDDKDGQNDYEQLPEYLKNSNLILPVPGHPIAIPLPYGLNVPIVAGMGLMRSMFSDEPDKNAKAAINLVQAVTKSFNPMGDEASLAQFLSPTLTDPIIQSGENIDSLGRKIVRDRYRGEENLPDSEITSRKDSDFAKSAAEMANRLTGGSRVKPGLFDVSPATIDNTVSWVGGSALRFVKDLTGQTGNIPVWNDFVKTPKNYFYTGRFWDQLEELRSLKDSARQLDENARKDQLIDMGMDPDRAEAFNREDLRKMVKLSADRSDKLSKEVQKISGQRAKLLPMYEELRKQISALNKSGDPNADDRIEAIVKAANRKYIEATR